MSSSEESDIEVDEAEVEVAKRKWGGKTRSDFHKITNANKKRGEKSPFGRESLKSQRERGKSNQRRDPHAENEARGFRDNRPLPPQQEPTPMEGVARSGGSHNSTSFGVASIMRHPQDHTLTADGFKFSKVYHLILRTMTPAIYNEPFTAGNDALVAYLPGLYTFDPGHMKQYMNAYECGILRGVTGFNLKCNKIWGKANVLGPGSPFITNTSGTAATNSQITMSRMTGRGLDKVLPMIAGRVAMPEIGTTQSEFLPVNKCSAGKKDALWFEMQSGELAAAMAITGGLTQVKSPPSDMGYTKYNWVSGVMFKHDTDKTTIVPPMLGKLMSESDVSENPGPLFQFEEHPNFYAKLQGIADASRNHNINSDYNTIVKPPTTPGACTAALQAGSTGAINYIPTASTDDGYIVSNNAFMAGGKNHVSQHSLDKHYVMLVPPPTTDESLIQECNLYVTYECGIEWSLRTDTVQQTNMTSALGTALISQGAIYNGNQVFATPMSDAMI